jgi:hypothetical protein
MKQIISLDKMQRYLVLKQETVLDACLLLVDCFSYSLTLGMEEFCSSETSVKFYRTTRRHIPEDAIFQY